MKSKANVLGQQIASIMLAAALAISPAGPTIAAGAEPKQTASDNSYENGFVREGDYITYTIKVKNQSTVTVKNGDKTVPGTKEFTITDPIPDGVCIDTINTPVNGTNIDGYPKLYDKTGAEISYDKTSAKLSEEVSAKAKTIVWKITVTNASDSKTPVEASVSFKAKVDRVYTVDTNGKLTETYIASYKNTAKIEVDEAEMDSTTTTNQPLHKPIKHAYLGTEVIADDKTVVEYSTTAKDALIDGEMVKSGDVIVYEITFDNNSAESKTFKVTDTVPTNLEFVATVDTDTVAANNGSSSDGKTVTWTGITVESGKSATAAFAVKVTDKAKNSITINDTATIESDGKTMTADPVEVPVIKEPVKSVVTSANNDADEKFIATRVKDGNGKEQAETLTYTIAVTNPSSDAKTFTITDKTPAGTTFKQFEATKGMSDDTQVETNHGSDGSLTWTLKIDSKKTAYVSFTVEVKDTTLGAEITNEAIVTVDNVKDTNFNSDKSVKSNEVVTWTLDTPSKKVADSTTSTAKTDSADGSKTEETDTPET